MQRMKKLSDHCVNLRLIKLFKIIFNTHLQEFNQEEINNKDIEIQRHLVKIEEQERQQRQMAERYRELEKTNRVKIIGILYKI